MVAQHLTMMTLGWSTRLQKRKQLRTTAAQAEVGDECRSATIRDYRRWPVAPVATEALWRYLMELREERQRELPSELYWLKVSRC